MKTTELTKLLWQAVNVSDPVPFVEAEGRLDHYQSSRVGVAGF